jgi:geranylgeranyl pyrophosphate synthase
VSLSYRGPGCSATPWSGRRVFIGSIVARRETWPSLVAVNVAALLPLPGLQTTRLDIEHELRRSVASDNVFLTEVAGHLISAGGGRWRPTLAVASALAGGGSVTRDVIRGACSVELVHLGTLYHDDVIDEAPTRRNVESVNARWGNNMAILGGDFLLARASSIAASLGTEVSGLLAATIGRLCEGEVSELQTAFSVERPEEAYFGSIADKTASLFSAACRIGGLVAGLDRRSVDGLTSFGEAFGVVFQIIDDIKDLVLSEEELGKPAGHDLIEGVYTLPVLRALAAGEIGEELRGLLGGPIGRPEAEKARGMVLASGGIESAVGTAREWADRAGEALGSVGDGAATAALAGVGHALLDQLPA